MHLHVKHVGGSFLVRQQIWRTRALLSFSTVSIYRNKRHYEPGDLVASYSCFTNLLQFPLNVMPSTVFDLTFLSDAQNGEL